MGKCFGTPSRSELFQDCHNPLLAWNPHLKFLAKEEEAKVFRGSDAISTHLFLETLPT